MKLINLDEAVINGLNFLKNEKIPKINFKKFNFPLITGSGNAYNAAKIIFQDKPMVLANESDLKEKVKNYKQLITNKTITQGVIISASGGKDSVWQTKYLNKQKLNTTLFTCTPNSPASQEANNTVLFSKTSEPYTYNFSTYLAMVLAKTKEKPENIEKILKKIKLPKNYKNYKSYSLILPDKYEAIVPMLRIKQSELFGPKLCLRAFTEGQARHAKYIIPWEKELVISFNVKNKYFGHPKHKWEINLPQIHEYGLMLSLTYYLIGKIQESKPDYFKRNIKNYCQDYGPKAYGKNEEFDVIVPGK